MVKRVLSLLLCITMLLATSLAMAGGAAPCYPPPAPAPCGQYGVQQGAPCAYWGDAPFPGLCGGVVALPFLVVGSLLGGNTVAPYGPPPAPGYRYAPPPAPIRMIPQPMNTGYAPAYGAPCGSGSPLGGGMLGGLPCLELCQGLLSSLTGGLGFGL